MSISRLDRRQFLTLPIALLLAPLGAAAYAQPLTRRSRYVADVGVLYDVLTFHLEGTIDETIDRRTGRYHVVIAGDGASISNRIESSGRFGDQRWVPLQSRSWFKVRGRVSRTEVDYDYTRRLILYRARGETFFLRKVRVVDDVVTIPRTTHVDDVVSATLNYEDGLWAPENGFLRTHVVRRGHPVDEGPDDVANTYRAELAPLEAKLDTERRDGKSSALFELSPFSSWIRPSKPAHIVFGENRRPELIDTAMILGSSVKIRLAVV